MAIDTRDRRGSVIGMGLVSVFPLADGSVDQADRQQTVHLYRGILAQIIIPPLGSIRVSRITLEPQIQIENGITLT